MLCIGMTDFSILSISDSFKSNISSLGYVSMTAVQADVLPDVLSGKDCVVQANTGSGKTAAFGIGIINKIDIKNMTPQALILAPTRELALQVSNELRKLGRFLPNLKIVNITGGEQEQFQLKSLNHGAHIIVGTPGRVLRFLKDEYLDLTRIESFVLDEADRMLDMGFIDSLDEINSYLPAKKQNLFFSATYPDELEDLFRGFLSVINFYKVDEEQLVPNISQEFFRVDSHSVKIKQALNILYYYQPESVIIFCKTKQICEDLTKFLNKNDIEAVTIHGDIDQKARNLALTKFANKSSRILVATDVAARGLDIEKVKLVFNLDLPNDPDVYTHRIGRTGRQGEKGQAISFVTSACEYKVDKIEKESKIKIHLKDLSLLSTSHTSYVVPEMITLFISLGKKDKIRPIDIVGTILNESDIEKDSLGKINIFSVFSYLSVKKDQAEKILALLDSRKIKKKNFRSGIA